MITAYRVRLIVALAATATAAAPLAQTLEAQAFGLNEIGSCALSRGFANTGSPCKDASLVYWNPAAGTQLPGWSLLAGVAAIALNGDFTRDTTRDRFDSDVPTQWVPHLFVNYHKASSKLAYGAGMYTPYGLTSQWKSDFPGRFNAQKAALKSVYIQPNVSYQINEKWSVGGGPIYGWSSVELRQSVDLSDQVASGTTTFAQLGIPRRTEFAQVALEGSGSATGLTLGVAGKLSDRWTFGARWLSNMWFKYDGADATFTQVPTGLVLSANNPLSLPAGTKVDDLVKASFAPGGKLVNQNASTELVFPAQVEAGVGYTGFKDWNLSADVAWVGWHRLRQIVINFADTTTPDRTLIEDYNSTTSLRFGAEREWNDWKLRGGFAFAASAAPEESVTPLLPEMNRSYGNVGVGIPLRNNLWLDAAYSHIFTRGMRGRIDDRTARTQTAAQLNTGAYTLNANILMVSLRATR